MPKPSKRIHGKDKPRYLQNERKQEMKRDPKYIPPKIPKNTESLEINSIGLLFFYMALNSELIKFSSTFPNQHLLQYELNTQSARTRNQNFFKHYGTSVELDQDDEINISPRSKK
jgi:hypothetical protein